MINEEDVTAALLTHATPVGDGWSFTGAVHSEQTARRIVEACLLFDQPVTDIVTAQAWLAMVFRLTDMERRVAELEAAVIRREAADAGIHVRIYPLMPS